MIEFVQSESPITVATIAASEALRDALAAAIARSPSLRSVGTFAGVDEMIDVTRGQHVDVALGFLPPRDSSSLLKWRSLFDAGTTLLFLSTYPDERDALRSAMAGAAGFVTRLVRTGEIVNTIVEVANGGTLSSAMVGTRLQQVQQGSWHLEVSERELAVVRAALGRLKTADIAKELRCSKADVLAVLCHVSECIDS